MAIVSVLFMIITIWIGIETKDWFIASYGLIPLSIGLSIGFFAQWQEKKLEEELKNDPEKAKRIEKILRDNRNGR